MSTTFTKHLHTKHAILGMIVFHFLLTNTCGVTLVVQAQEVRLFTKPLHNHSVTCFHSSAHNWGDPGQNGDPVQSTAQCTITLLMSTRLWLSKWLSLYPFLTKLPGVPQVQPDSQVRNSYTFILHEHMRWPIEPNGYQRRFFNHLSVYIYCFHVPPPYDHL